MQTLIIDYEFPGIYPLLSEYFQVYGDVFFIHHHNIFTFKTSKNLYKISLTNGLKNTISNEFILNKNNYKSQNMRLEKILSNNFSILANVDFIFCNIDYFDIRIIKQFFPDKYIIGISEILVTNKQLKYNIDIVDYYITPYKKCLPQLKYSSKNRFYLPYNTDNRKFLPSDNIINLKIENVYLDDNKKIITSILESNHFYTNSNILFAAIDKILSQDKDINYIIIDHINNNYTLNNLINYHISKSNQKRLHIIKNISITSWQKILQRSFLFINLDNLLKIPNYIFEAMSSGCICILNNTYLARNIIKNNYNGWLANGFNEHEISFLIEQIFEKLEFSNFVASNAIKTIYNNHSYNVGIDILENILQNVYEDIQLNN